MKLKLDLHVHTTRSRDGFNKIEDLASLVKKRGLDGLAITDHNRVVLHPPTGVSVIPGIEVSASQGHIIGLGISTPISRGLSAEETIEQIRRLGGVAVIPHPYDFFRPSVNPELLTVTPDAIEVINSSSFLHSVTWKRARRFAEKARLPPVAGSDSHIPHTLGRAFTIVETDSHSNDSILEAIRKGSVMPAGRPITAAQRLRKFALRMTGRR